MLFQCVARIEGYLGRIILPKGYLDQKGLGTTGSRRVQVNTKPATRIQPEKALKLHSDLNCVSGTITYKVNATTRVRANWRAAAYASSAQNVPPTRTGATKVKQRERLETDI